MFSSSRPSGTRGDRHLGLESAWGDGEVAPAAPKGRTVQPAGRGVPRQLEHRLVAESARYPARVRGIGQRLGRPVGGGDLEEVLHPVDVRPVDHEHPAAAVVVEVELVARDPDLLVEPHRAQRAVRVVEAEGHGPLVDGWPSGDGSAGTPTP